MPTIAQPAQVHAAHAAVDASRVQGGIATGQVAGALLAILLVTYPPRMVANLTINGADIFLLVFAVFNLSVLVALMRSRVMMGFTAFYAFIFAVSFHYSSFYFFNFDALTLQIVKNFVSVAFFGMSVMFFLRMPSAASAFMSVTLIMSCVMAVYGAYTAFFGDVPRAMATFENPNALAAYLLFGFSYVLIRVLTDRITGGRVAVLLLLLVAFLATGSRGAILGGAAGAAVAALFIIYFHSRQKDVRRNARNMLLVLGPATLGYVFYKLFLGGGGGGDTGAMPIALARLYETMNGDVKNLEQRLFYWLMAWNLFESSPWVGVGLGQFERFMTYVIDRPIVTHNTYLSYLAEAGIVGVLACAAFIAYALRQAWTVGRAHPQLVFCGCFLTAIFVQGLVTNVDNFRIFWIGLGLTVACVHSPEVRAALTSRRGI